MKEALDLYVISGFLGAGKTTFVQKMLEQFVGKKTGVLVNEFGGFGVDAKLLNRDGIHLVEINNGSVFCSCLKADFVKTLIALTKEDLDVLLIESSGMADPSNMNSLLEDLQELVHRKYNYRGAVCLLDASTFLKQVKVLAPVQNQVAASNLILLNKTDLANENTIIQIQETIRSINVNAHIYQTIFSEVPFAWIEEHLCNNGYVGETSNQDWNRPTTYSVECKEKKDILSIRKFMEQMVPYAFRIKGLLDTKEGWYQLDSVGSTIDIRPFCKGKRDVIQYTKLVLIGVDQMPFLEELKKTWYETVGGEMEMAG